MEVTERPTSLNPGKAVAMAIFPIIVHFITSLLYFYYLFYYFIIFYCVAYEFAHAVKLAKTSSSLNSDL